MAKNELVKAFNGFVVYESQAEEGHVIDLTKIPNVENFEFRKYQIAKEDEVATIGFVPVIELEVTQDGEVIREEEFVHSVGNFDVVKIKQSKRKVPASEVKKIVNAKTKQAVKDADARGEEDFKVTKDMKDGFKEDAIKELLPRCFVDEFETFVFFDKTEQKVYVVVPSHKKAENLTHFIRVTLSSLPVVPMSTENFVGTALTNFVTDQLNDKITLGNFVQLEDEEGVVAWKKESLYNSDAKELVENSEKKVTKLELNYDGTVNFIVDTDYVFSGVKFESYVAASAEEFSSTFLIIANELSGAVKELVKEISK